MSNKPNVNEMKKNIERIKKINMKLSHMSLTEKENHFFDNYPDIMGKYPFIVSIICSGSDLTMLDYMLSSLEQVEKGNSSQEYMDKIVGERLADEYVNPLIDENKE
jgi:ABC-type enterochelin transport system ATPase subunit